MEVSAKSGHNINNLFKTISMTFSTNENSQIGGTQMQMGNGANKANNENKESKDFQNNMLKNFFYIIKHQIFN